MRHAVLLAVSAAFALGCSSSPRSPDSPATHYWNAIVGGTFEREDGGPTLGGTYEYAFREKLGIGAFADATIGSDTAVALGPAVFWHPLSPRWTFIGGIGAELGHGDSNLLARAGGWYNFPMKSFTIAPAAWIDFGLGDPVVFIGASFGWRF